MALGTNLPVFPALIFTYIETGKLFSMTARVHTAAQLLMRLH
jgi:hypothetical protein